MKPIDLNQIPSEYIMRTKAGNLWRCGRGYRKNWAKLIGKLVLLHNTPYTLINRIKEAGKWYLIFTDGTNNYTERQDKALHNKHLAKDTIIEAVKRVIAGLLPAPKELIDQLVDEINRLNANRRQAIIDNTANYTKSGTLKKQVERKMNIEYPLWTSSPLEGLELFECKLLFILNNCGEDKVSYYMRKLIRAYHPDVNTSSYATDYTAILNEWNFTLDEI